MKIARVTRLCDNTRPRGCQKVPGRVQVFEEVPGRVCVFDPAEQLRKTMENWEILSLLPPELPENQLCL